MMVVAPFLLVSTLMVASPPASRPAENVEAAMAQLVRNLSHPQLKKRKAAAARLVELGNAAEESLEKAKSNQPAELQNTIDQILRDIRQSRHGALVLLVTADGQASRKRIMPGDLFLAIDGKPIDDIDAWSKAEGDHLRNQARTIRLRRGGRIFDEEFQAGRYGIYYCKYEAAWGDHLADAARQHNLGNCSAAAASIDQAIEAGRRLGVNVETVRGAVGIIAHCRYYARPSAERSAYLESLLKTSPYKDNLTDIISFAMASHPEDLHLPDEICRRVIKSDDKAVWARNHLVYRLAFCERRYADALVELLKTGRASETWSPEDGASALHMLGLCLDALDADAELSAVLDRLAAFPEGRTRFRWLFPAAVKVGRLDLCETVLPEIGEGEGSEGEAAVWDYLHAKDRIYQVHLRRGQVDKCREALATGLADFGFAQDVRLYAAYWPKTADLWVRRAEELLDQGPALNVDFLLSAFAFQVDPDLAEFEQAIVRCEAIPRIRAGATLHRARLEALKGDYAASLTRYETIRAKDEQNKPWNKPWDVQPEMEAIRFLSEHAKHLTGQGEKWRRALYAYKTDDGTRYLITRDIRIGKASPDGQVREIPLPEPGWWPYQLADGLIVSASGRTVLAVSRENVYQLKADATGWSLLMHIPFSQRGWAVHKLAPWADELSAELQLHEPQARSIVLPETFQDLNNAAPIDPFMLGDGTWLYCQPKPRRMFNLSAMLTAHSGVQAQIYGCFRAKGDGAFYLGTERGLYHGIPEGNQFALIPLPGQNQTSPVMIVSERLPRSADFRLFAAVLPHAGGTMFSIDLNKQQVVPISIINERMPASYWSSRPPTERIAEVKVVLQKSMLRWEDLQTFVTQPASHPVDRAK